MILQALKLAISQSMELFSARKTAVCRSQWVIPFTTWSCPWAGGSKVGYYASASAAREGGRTNQPKEQMRVCGRGGVERGPRGRRQPAGGAGRGTKGAYLGSAGSGSAGWTRLSGFFSGRSRPSRSSWSCGCLVSLASCLACLS